MSSSIPSNAKSTSTNAALGVPQPRSRAMRIHRTVIDATVLVMILIQSYLVAYQFAVHPLADYSGKRDMSPTVFILKRLTPLLIVGSGDGYLVLGIVLIVLQVGFLYVMHQCTEPIYRKCAIVFIVTMASVKGNDLAHDQRPDGIAQDVAIMLGCAAYGVCGVVGGLLWNYERALKAGCRDASM
ncbi:hypothetical protein AMAG_11621 [Allomyces macrogynus ATCC 38327]|uniref:Uncharacterized protein n=1 Tax=Allomyces macrogynus (strain ATCC 38327) TaxID=578462 RepID=A0A0L0SV96_ALLM3|nr:hypothetical protein AMAG_11621 [Allomyces macrogynus ATCC 38327]|eukprot:KNE66483.1 hypothetical protein AMAG_11621 [Allomyces macrogynus ATCC 38327]